MAATDPIAESIYNAFFTADGKEVEYRPFGPLNTTVYLNNTPKLDIGDATLFSFQNDMNGGGGENGDTRPADTRTTIQALVMLDKDNPALDTLKRWYESIMTGVFNAAKKSKKLRDQLGLSIEDTADPVLGMRFFARAFNPNIKPIEELREGKPPLRPSLNVQILFGEKVKDKTVVAEPYMEPGSTTFDEKVLSQIPPDVYSACNASNVPVRLRVFPQQLVFGNGKKHGSLRIKAEYIVLKKPLALCASSGPPTELQFGDISMKLLSASETAARRAAVEAERDIPMMVPIAMPVAAGGGGGGGFATMPSGSAPPFGGFNAADLEAAMT